MERSRSKRAYYDYDNDQDSNGRNKRYQSQSQSQSQSSSSYYSTRPPPPRLQKSSHSHGDAPSICFRILCPDAKAGSVIGKGGSIISTLRRETGARINVQNIIQGDDERIIEVSDGRRLDPDTPATVSPAQEALMKIHSRIIDGGNNNANNSNASNNTSKNGNGYFDKEEEDQNRRITTRLVVPRNHVGCLLGKGGKIIEQMRVDTKTQIRILPRDQHLPRCVSPSEEIVQIVGELNAVKKALRIISTRLTENPPRERPPASHGRVYSPEHHLPPDDDFSPHGNSLSRRSSIDGPMLGMRSSAGFSSNRGSGHHLRTSGYMLSEYGGSHMSDYEPSFSGEELVFRILCPNEKIGSVIGEDGGIIKRLREDIGVNIKVTDSVPGSDERIIIISANEVPDDNLFPAQEALLHIQSCIVDLGPDKDGVITTRLLVPANEVGCLHGKGGSIISEMRRQTRANIQILPREYLPPCALGADELVQIVGDIRVAREALVQVTSRLRSNLHREMPISRDRLFSSLPALAHLGSQASHELSSPGISNSYGLGFQGGSRLASSYENLPPSPGPSPSKDAGSGARSPSDNEEIVAYEEGFARLGRSAAGLVTKTTVEVVIPEHAIAALIGNSQNNIAQISEMSGAIVNLLEVRPGSERVVEISGSPEQTHTAQSLLQAFILNGQSSFAAQELGQQT
eukprot:Gb_38220 [translate_table: standard]